METKVTEPKTKVPHWTKFKNYRRSPPDEKPLAMSATSRYRSTEDPELESAPESSMNNSYFTLIAVPNQQLKSFPAETTSLANSLLQEPAKEKQEKVPALIVTKALPL